MSATYSWKIVWITGASSGIGREMALQLARAGVRVAASARSADALARLAALHANITAFPVDVTDAAALSTTHARIEAELGPIDLAILNAGVYSPLTIAELDAKTISAAFGVNVLGITNALVPLVPAMLKRGSGHIALVSSIAGYRGLPRGAAYAPTKAAVISLAECLECELHDKNIEISVICPGYVETSMTEQNHFAMPFILKPDDAAQRIIKGLAKRKYEIAFPWPMVILTKLGRRAPHWLYFAIVRFFQPMGEV